MNKYKSIIIGVLLLIPLNVNALTKEETVYSKLNNDGSVKTIIVNEHIINKDKSDIIEDLTDLTNIKNINSDKPFDIVNNKITWNSQGNDIFYQGNSNKELPIKEVITYKLDGKDITLEDLLGKKGKVEINIKYINNSKNNININGSNEVLYTPFVVSTITTISNSNNSNIKVNNGKVVDNGIGYVVVGLSTPGLYESLGLDELKNLDNISIEYDTNKFELSSIYSVITPKIIDSNDLTIFDKLNNMYKDVTKLQSSMDRIEEGSTTILKNLNTISEGSNQISSNLKLVLDNLEKIKNGTIELDSGLQQIVSKLEESQSKFNNLEEKLNNMQYLINKNNQTIEKLTNVKNNYEYMSSLPIIPDNMKEQYTQLKIIYDNMNLGSDTESMINLLEGNNLALNSSMKAFTNIKDSINELNIYLPKLKAGADSLSEGTNKLRNGVAILNDKMSQLSQGTSSLKDGMSTLNTGITTFNNEGINNITKLSNKLENLSSKTKELIKLSNNYQSFSIKDDSTISNTKFILVVDGKKSKNIAKEETSQTKEETFLDRIKNLFK